MGFNSAFKVLKLLKKKPGNGRLNNLNDPVLNVLSTVWIKQVEVVYDFWFRMNKAPELFIQTLT